MDEVNVDPVDLGHEVGQGAQFRLALAPVVICRPVARERLDRRQLHALRMIFDELPVGPACGSDTRTQRLEFLLRGDRDRERPDRCDVRRPFGRARHEGLLGWFLVETELVLSCAGGPCVDARYCRHRVCASPN